MRKIIGILVFAIGVTIASHAQMNTRKIAFELRYPIPMGDNYLNKGWGSGYSGIIDIGVDYNVIKKNGWGVGVLFNSSILKLSKTNVTLYILSPKFKVDYELKMNKFSIIPQIAVGYSNWRFRAPEMTVYDEFGDPLESEKYKENRNGLTIKGATKFVLNNSNRLHWYLQIAYEFTKLDDSSNLKYNRNMSLLYPGVGVIWNFNKE